MMTLRNSPRCLIEFGELDDRALMIRQTMKTAGIPLRPDGAFDSSDGRLHTLAIDWNKRMTTFIQFYFPNGAVYTEHRSTKTRWMRFEVLENEDFQAIMIRTTDSMDNPGTTELRPIHEIVAMAASFVGMNATELSRCLWYNQNTN